MSNINAINTLSQPCRFSNIQTINRTVSLRMWQQVDIIICVFDNTMFCSYTRAVQYYVWFERGVLITNGSCALLYK